MTFYLDLYKGTAALEKKEFDELMSLNAVTREHSIELTKDKVQYIIDSRKSALSDMGRIEFGESTAKKLVLKFCDSPYVSKHNIERIIGDLLEIFYYTKNETDDLIKDDTLIDYMYKAFNGECKGSVSLLYDWAINKLIHDVHFRGLPKDEENEAKDGENTDEQWN